MCNPSTVGIIADTHGWFDPKIPKLFSQVDHILHAGDFGSLEVRNKLELIAPVIAVRGNVDKDRLLRKFLPQRYIQLFNTTILLIHILGNPHSLSKDVLKSINEINPQVVVFGHSHIPFLKQINNILYFNPGSAGPKRFNLPRTIGFLDFFPGEVKGRIINL